MITTDNRKQAITDNDVITIALSMPPCATPLADLSTLIERKHKCSYAKAFQAASRVCNSGKIKKVKSDKGITFVLP